MDRFMKEHLRFTEIGITLRADYLQCPVCKKEIFNVAGLSPECGQRLE